jgi:hypothetical protein
VHACTSSLRARTPPVCVGERERVVYIDLERDGVCRKEYPRVCVREDECMRAPLLFVYVLNLEYKCMCVTSTYREMVCARSPERVVSVGVCVGRRERDDTYVSTQCV